jgi:hypothetical protein
VAEFLQANKINSNQEIQGRGDNFSRVSVETPSIALKAITVGTATTHHIHASNPNP